MKVFLARHGETVGNSLGLILGQKDFPLTERGVQATSKMADMIKERVLKGIIISSPLCRAIESAKIYAEKTGCPIEVMNGMKELSCGHWEGQKRNIVARDKPFIRSDWTDAPPEGESCEEAEPRVACVVEKINILSEYDTVVVMGHAGVNRVFFKLWLEMEPSVIINVFQPHDLVYILDDSREIYWVNADGKTGSGLIIDKP